MLVQMSPASSTERALIANIAAAPDDDAPRLVYADWLTEQDDPRGELVVVQCALARGDHDDEPESVLAPLRDRESALLAQHRDRWLEPLLEIAVGTYLHRRGLVERLDVLQPSIDGERLRETVPLLRAIRTSQHHDVASYARAIPVEELTLYELRDTDEARRVCQRAELPRLRKLDLHYRSADADVSRLGVVGERPLVRFGIHVPVMRSADPPMLLDEVLPQDRGALRSLQLTRVRLDDLRPLASLGALEELVLVGCQLSVDQLADVELPALRALSITDRAVAPAEIAALLDRFELRRLRLARDWLDSAAATAIAHHPRAASLRRLDLAGNRIEAAGGRALVSSPHLAQLATLDMTGNPFDAAAEARARHAFAVARGDSD